VVQIGCGVGDGGVVAFREWFDQGLCLEQIAEADGKTRKVYAMCGRGITMNLIAGMNE
jgi:hypothetical protein